MSLSLRHHYPTEIQYWASEDAFSQPAILNAQYGVNLGPNTNNPLDWRVSLTVEFFAKIAQQDIAKGKIVFVGYFDVGVEVPENERQTFVARNGASVLYAAVRELVANITCRSTNRHITLPLTSFHNLQIDSNAPRKEVSAQSTP